MKKFKILTKPKAPTEPQKPESHLIQRNASICSGECVLTLAKFLEKFNPIIADQPDLTKIEVQVRIEASDYAGDYDRGSPEIDLFWWGMQTEEEHQQNLKVYARALKQYNKQMQDYQKKLADYQIWFQANQTKLQNLVQEEKKQAADRLTQQIEAQEKQLAQEKKKLAKLQEEASTQEVKHNES